MSPVMNPTQRKPYLSAVTPQRRNTILIGQYLSDRIGECGKEERRDIRAFIDAFNVALADVRQWNAETAWNWLPKKPEPFLVAVKQKSKVDVYVFLPKVGRVTSFPILTIPCTATLVNIVRETSAFPFL